ncbi:MAG: NAD(P)H-dependent oxidoreductase [[Clostridium] scindens]
MRSLRFCRNSQADGLIIGSPVYFHSLTGHLQAFLESCSIHTWRMERNIIRLLQAHAHLYTMNATEEKHNK